MSDEPMKPQNGNAEETTVFRPGTFLPPMPPGDEAAGAAPGPPPSPQDPREGDPMSNVPPPPEGTPPAPGFTPPPGYTPPPGPPPSAPAPPPSPGFGTPPPPPAAPGFGAPPPAAPAGYPPPAAPGGYTPPPAPGAYAPPPGPAYGAPAAFVPVAVGVGQYAPRPDERSAAMWAHLGAFLVELLTCGTLGFIPPLILMTGKGKESPYVRHHAGQALGFWLVLLIGTIISGILSFFLIGFLTGLFLFVWWLVFRIIGTMKANAGEWYRIPANIPLGGS